MKSYNLIIIFFWFYANTSMAYSPFTKFEKRCYTIWETRGKENCLKYINKKLSSGQLTSVDKLNAYYLKAELFLHYTNRGPKSHNFNLRYWPHDQITSINPIQQLDSCLHYSKLLVERADTTYLFEEQWIEMIYNPLCHETLNLWEQIHPINQSISPTYYWQHKDEYFYQKRRFESLKSMMRPFHPINRLGLEIAELKFRVQLGISTPEALEKLAPLIYDYLLKENQYYYFQSLHSTNYERTCSFNIIDEELRKYIFTLFLYKNKHGQTLLNKCPTHLFKHDQSSTNIYTKYNSYWTIHHPLNQELDLIDLRDSAIYQQNSFPIYYNVLITYDLPEWDTLHIDQVKDDHHYPTTELINQLHLTGKGVDTLKLRFYEPLPNPNSTRHFNRKVTIISNRGFKSFILRAEIIGQDQLSETAKADQSDQIYNHNADYYKAGVIGIRVSPTYGTDQIKIYRYPLQSEPTCIISNGEPYSNNSLIYPIERKTDSIYHFQLLAEYPDYYHVVYSNFVLNTHIGWIKKSDFDTSFISLSNLIKKESWDDYYRDGDYIQLRNPLERIHVTNGNFGEEFISSCNRFTYKGLDTKNGAHLKIGPCENCTNPTFLKNGFAWVNWYRNDHMYIERVKIKGKK